MLVFMSGCGNENNSLSTNKYRNSFLLASQNKKNPPTTKTTTIIINPSNPLLFPNIK